jgi:hypothetical protein
VAAQIPVASVVDAFDLLPAEREQELDVGGRLRVVRELVGAVRAHAQAVVAEAERAVEPDALGEPVLEPLLALARMDEELELGLLELARAEREVARVDLVAKRLADLRDAERDLLARALAHALRVEEDRLTRLGAQERHGRRVLLRADEGLQHQVEVARRRPVVLRRALARRTRAGVVELVGAHALLAGLAVDQRIAEVLDVARRLPGPRVRDDRRVEAFDVVALAHDLLPPERLQVVLELDAERAVVPEAVDAAVDLARLPDEAATRAERDDVVHARHHGRGIHPVGTHSARASVERSSPDRSKEESPFPA